MTGDGPIRGRHAPRHKNGERKIEELGHKRQGSPGRSMGNPVDIDAENELSHDPAHSRPAGIDLNSLGTLLREGQAGQRSLYSKLRGRGEGSEAQEKRADDQRCGNREEHEQKDRRANRAKPTAGSSPFMPGRDSMASTNRQTTHGAVPEAFFFGKTASNSTSSRQRDINNSRTFLSAASSSQANQRNSSRGNGVPSDGTSYNARDHRSPDVQYQDQPNKSDYPPQSSSIPHASSSTELSYMRPSNSVPNANDAGMYQQRDTRSSRSPQKPEHARDSQNGLHIGEADRPLSSPPRALRPPSLDNTADKKGKGKERNSTHITNLGSRDRPDEINDDIKSPDGPFDRELLQDGIKVMGHSFNPTNGKKRRPDSQTNQIGPKHLTASPAHTKGLRGSSRMRNKDGHVASSEPRRGQSSTGTIISSLPPRACPAEVDTIWINGSMKLNCRQITVGTGGLQVDAPGNKFWQILFPHIQELGICYDPDHPSASLDIPSPGQWDTEIFESMLQGSERIPLSHGTANGRLNVLVLLQRGQTSTEALDALKKRVDKKQHDALHADNCAELIKILPKAGQKDRGSNKHSRRRSAVQRTSLSRESTQLPNLNIASKSGAKLKDEREEQSVEQKTKKGKPQQQDPFQSKLNFNAADTSNRRSMRLSGAQGDSGRSSSRSVEPKLAAKSMAKVNKNELHFPYPLTGRADVNVTYGDSMRLQEGEFLNDTLLEFGLRYVLAELHQELRDTIHLFNSFFYNKLADKSKKNKRTEDAWPAYDSVKKWTKGKDIFKKKLIVVPINESYHWYLAVIVNPGGMLRRKVIPIPVEVPKPVTRSAAVLIDGHGNGISKDPVDDVDEEDLDDLASDQEGEKVSFPAQGSTYPEMPGQYPADPDQSMISNDPLDCINDDSDVVNVDNEARSVHISQGVKNMTLIDESEVDDEDDDLCSRSGDDSGKPISTPTLQAFQEQNRHQSPVEPITSPKKKAIKPDAEIVGSESTWILTFDSLGGSHKAVHTVLDSWLKYEAKDKLNIDYELEDATYWEAKVPQQHNFYDCGLYVIQFAKQLLARQDVVLSFIQRRAPSLTSPDRPAYDALMTETWKTDETGNLRQEWINIITTLASNYTSARDALAVNGQLQATPTTTTTSQDDQPSITAIEPPAQTEQPTEHDVLMESRAPSVTPEDQMPYRGTPVKSPTTQVDNASSSTLPLVDASSPATVDGSTVEPLSNAHLEESQAYVYPGQADGGEEGEARKSGDIDPSILGSISFDGPHLLETLAGRDAARADQEIIVDNDDNESEDSGQDQSSHTSSSLPRNVERNPAEFVKDSLSPPLEVSDGSPFQSLSNHAPGARKPTTPQSRSLPTPIYSSPISSMHPSGSSSWRNGQRAEPVPNSRERLHEVFNPSSSSNLPSKVDLGVDTFHSANEVSVPLQQVEEEDEPMPQAMRRRKGTPLQVTELGNGNEEDEEEEPVENRPASGRKLKSAQEARLTGKARTNANKAVRTAGAKRASTDTGAGLGQNKRIRSNVGTGKAGKNLEGKSRDKAIEIQSSDDDR